MMHSSLTSLDSAVTDITTDAEYFEMTSDKILTDYIKEDVYCLTVPFQLHKPKQNNTMTHSDFDNRYGAKLN